MSYTIVTDVFCDGCPQWVHGDNTASNRIQKRKADACARREGWLVKDGSHYCPDCRKIVEKKASGGGAQ